MSEFLIETKQLTKIYGEQTADHIKNRGSQFFCLPRPLFSGCFSAALFFYSKN